MEHLKRKSPYLFPLEDRCVIRPKIHVYLRFRYLGTVANTSVDEVLGVVPGKLGAEWEPISSTLCFH